MSFLALFEAIVVLARHRLDIYKLDTPWFQFRFDTPLFSEIFSLSSKRRLPIYLPSSSIVNFLLVLRTRVSWGIIERVARQTPLQHSVFFSRLLR